MGEEGDENGDVMVYSLSVKDGSYTSAITTQQGQEKEMGVPPHWNVYLTVGDVDAVTASVAVHGGSVLADPFDVFDFGRMSVINDPTGAMLALWQPLNHIGAGVKYEPGSLEWCELLTLDTDTAVEFYSKLLGVEVMLRGMPDGTDYTVMHTEDVPAFGIMAMPDNLREMQMPSHWSIYFNVDDVDDATRQATANGAQIALAPTDVQDTARIAVLLDPQGAAFGLMKTVAH